MVKESKKASNAAWDKENMVYQTVKVKKDVLARFKAAVAERGEKVNTVIKDYMIAYASGNVPQGGTVATGQPAVEDGFELVKLPVGYADLAKAAAEASSTDLDSWLCGAIEEQNARDVKARELRELLKGRG